MSKPILQILAYHLGKKESDIQPEMLLEDLGCDSLDCIEICMDIEDKIGIMITDAELEEVHTVQDLYDLVDRKQAEKQAHLTPKPEQENVVTEQKEGTLGENKNN